MRQPCAQIRRLSREAEEMAREARKQETLEYIDAARLLDHSLHVRATGQTPENERERTQRQREQTERRKGERERAESNPDRGAPRQPRMLGHEDTKGEVRASECARRLIY